MAKEDILKSVYQYYPTIYETANKNKDRLRMKKINDKKFHKKNLYKRFKKILKGYTIIDWTDEEACCLEFKVLLHKNIDILDDDILLIEKLNGERNDLHIFISVLEPYYYLLLQKTKYARDTQVWEFFTIKNCDEYTNILNKNILNKIDKFMTQKKYYRLTDVEVLMPVPDVETCYKEINMVHVFDCLFTDLVTIS